MNEFDEYNAKYNDEEPPTISPSRTKGKLVFSQRAPALDLTNTPPQKKSKTSYWAAEMKLSDFISHPDNKKRSLSQPGSLPPSKKLKQTKFPSKKEPETPHFKIGKATIPVSLNEASSSLFFFPNLPVRTETKKDTC